MTPPTSPTQTLTKPNIDTVKTIESFNSEIKASLYNLEESQRINPMETIKILAEFKPYYDTRFAVNIDKTTNESETDQKINETLKKIDTEIAICKNIYEMLIENESGVSTQIKIEKIFGIIGRRNGMQITGDFLVPALTDIEGKVLSVR